MIVVLPDTLTERAIDAFAVALDALTPDRTIRACGGRFEILDLDDLANDARSAIRALAFASGGRIEGEAVPCALAHGAASPSQRDLLAWAGTDAPNAYPRLERIDVVGVRGFVARESWWRPADVVYGLTVTPRPGRFPVYEIEYTTWTWGQLPGGTDTGITRRGERTRRWYAEDGTVALEIVEEAKDYSYDRALSAGARRRVNVVGGSDDMTTSRVAGWVMPTLLATFPGEDPGPRVASLLGALDGEIRTWRASGQALHESLTTGRAALVASFAWLDTSVQGTALIDRLALEVSPPPNGENTP